MSGWESIEDRELLTFVLLSVTLLYLLYASRKLGLGVSVGWLLAALGIQTVGLFITVVEYLTPWQPALNVVEHACYALHTLLVVTWCVRLAPANRGGTP